MQTIKAQKTKYSGKALAVTAMFAARPPLSRSRRPSATHTQATPSSIWLPASCLRRSGLSRRPSAALSPICSRATRSGRFPPLSSRRSTCCRFFSHANISKRKAATRAFCIRSPLPCCCPPQPSRQSATLPPTWFCTTQPRLGRRCRSIWCSQPSAPFCLSPWHSRSMR